MVGGDQIELSPGDEDTEAERLDRGPGLHFYQITIRSSRSMSHRFSLAS